MTLRMVRFLVSAFFLLLSFSVPAQQFGGNPASLKWYQLNTDTARIIYPRGLDSVANRVAAIVHMLQKSNVSIGSKVRKVNVVLQNQPTISNAYVSLAPYRSEFYLTPPQNSFELGSLGWADNLAVHEYRHIQQYSNFNVGLSKFASFILGQEGQALANAIAVPDWFFEGDAVFNETSLSTNGRGRLPDFFNGYKSLLREGKKYSFMKLRNGSLRDFVPGHYELGYLLVGYGREKYGSNVWRNITHDAAAFKPLFYPLQGAVKRYTNIPYKQFVGNALQFYNDQWMQAETKPLNYITPVHPHVVSSYRYPYSTPDGVLVLKRTYRQIPAFYLINKNGGEKKIAVRDIAYDDYFSHNNGKIVYTALKPHSRWGYKEYSDIKMIDVQSGARKTISLRRRFFAPDISHDGKMFAAIEMATDQSSSIVLLNENGVLQKILASSKTNVYTYPKFSANDQFVYVATRNSKAEMALQKINVASSVVSDILPFGNRVIGFPVVQGDTLYFTSSYKGSDETWAYVEKNNSVFRVVYNPTGIYQAVYNAEQNAVIGSAFTAEGYRLVAIPVTTWQKADIAANALPDLYVANALQQQNPQTLNTLPARTFSNTRYRKAAGLVNIHSWRPYYDEPEYSFTVYSQNILNTLRFDLYYAYNRNERSNKVGVNTVYGAWYLQPLVGVNQTWQRYIRYNADTAFFYNEFNGLAGLQLPLNFTGGRQYRSLVLSTTVNAQAVNWTGLGKRLLNDQKFSYFDSRILYSGQVQKAAQHIYPHWAQTLQLRYRTIINKYTASQLLASGSLYLPGLHPAHNVVLTAAYQARDTAGQYFFSNNFPFSRGYREIDFPRMWRLGFNYHFTIAYPDKGVANVVYLKRLRANAFYDQTQTKSLRTGNKFFFGTAGAELLFDTRWWNQQEVSFGVRYSRLLNSEYRGITQPNQWEFILPVNLISN